MAIQRIDFAIDPKTPILQDGDHFLVPGKLFEAGNFPDKGFVLTESEIESEVSRFEVQGKPVPMNIEHRKTVLDGALGNIRKLWKDGKDLNATVAVPSWLYNLSKERGEALKVSAEWDMANPAEKKLIGAAYVLKPRISDAALIAAFSAETTYPGVVYHRNNPETKGRDAMPSLKENAEKLLKARDVDGLTADDIVALFSIDANRLAELEAAAKETRIKDRHTRAEQFADKAIFGDGTRGGRALPRERESLIAQFTLADSDDENSPATVAFSEVIEADGKTERKERTGTRVQALEASIAARLPHDLTKELLTHDQDGKALAEHFKGFKATFAEQETEQMQDNANKMLEPGSPRWRELHSDSAMGRQILEEWDTAHPRK